MALCEGETPSELHSPHPGLHRSCHCADEGESAENFLSFGNFQLLCSSMAVLIFQDAIKDGLRAVQNCVEDEATRLNADGIVNSDRAELSSNVVRKALILFRCRLDMFAFENFTIPPSLIQRPVGNCAWRRSIRGPICCIGVKKEKNMRSYKS